ncbi:hypothetical protein ACNKHQ_22490 [Shigella flexneri]
MAVTFDKAAAEMRHRMAELMGAVGRHVGRDLPRVGAPLLRAHHLDADLPQDLQNPR